MAFELTKLSLYILILLSLAGVQTTARRAQMLPLPNDNSTIPSSNDTKSLLTNDNSTTTTTTPTDTNYIKPISLSSGAPDDSQEAAKTNDDSFTPDVQNATSSPLEYFVSSPNSQEAAKRNDEFFSPDVQNATSSPSEYFVSPQNSEEGAKTNEDFFTPDVQNVTSYPPQYLVSSPSTQEATSTNDEFFRPPVQNDTSSFPQFWASASPPTQEATKTNDDFFTPSDVQNSTAPWPQTLGEQNDIVFSQPPPYLETDGAEYDVSFYTPLTPAAAPALTTVSDNISPSTDLSDYKNSPNVAPAAPVVDDIGDYSIDVNPAPPLVVLPSTYEADVEIAPELAEEIKAYRDSQENDQQSRTAVFVAGAICLVGVGGFLYKKKKRDALKKSQYEYLSKRDFDN